MRALLVASAATFLGVVGLSTFSRSPEREAQAPRYFSADEIARGRRLSLERRLLFFSAEGVQVAFFCWLVVSGAAATLAARCEALAGGRFWWSLLLVGGALFLAQELLSFPWSLFGGLHHQRAWGLTDRSFSSWLTDHLKGLVLSGAIGGALLAGLYFLIRSFPSSWWLAAGLSSGLVAVFFAYLAPVLIAPLFNSFTPLGDTKQAALQPRIERLAAEAGLPVQDVLVMDASRQGRHTNAYFTGFGGTRRIVLYDTLLASHTEDETLSILGHEMGHWRRHHIVKGIALGTLGALLGFFALGRILEWCAGAGRFGLRSVADPAGVPLVLLLSVLGGLVSAPAQNAVSRTFEREADHDALTLFGHPEVFVDAEQRLARDNIANVVPSDWNVLLFATHPPTLDRIAMAEAFVTLRNSR